MKILHVINGLGTGGAQRSMAEMLPGLRARGVEVEIVCFFTLAEGVEADVRRQVPVHVVRSRRLLARARAVRHLAVGLRADLIHTTISDANLAGRLAALGTGIPVLTSLVTTPFVPLRMEDPNIHPLRLRAARVIDRLTGRHLTTHFHAITEAVKADAVRSLGLPPERITVVVRGRDPDRLGLPGPDRRRMTRHRLGLREDDLVILNVARQEFPKGQRDLIAAFDSVAAVHPRAVLMIAGRAGRATADLQGALRGCTAADRIMLLGHREDVPDLLAAADVFVFPSLYEGLGGALIEAMALALPIVASDVPAIREVVDADRNAVLVPPGHPARLAAALSSLLADPVRRRAFSRRSRELFDARFTLDRSVAAMAELYAAVVKGSAGALMGHDPVARRAPAGGGAAVD